MSDDKCVTIGKCVSDIDKCTVKNKITTPKDYIAVAGSAEGSWDITLTKARFREQKGNRYRFINTAIRALYTYPEPVCNSDNIPKIQRILVVFQFKYTSNDILRINEYAEEAKARVIYVKSVDELINFLNLRKEKLREIAKLEFFSHGVIGKICFHYSNDAIEHKRESSGELTRNSIDKLKDGLFASNGVIVSYACRTGININKESFQKGEYAGQNESLAQYMANKLNITVKAFERRSDYAFTYDYKKFYTKSVEYDYLITGAPKEVYILDKEKTSQKIYDNPEYKSEKDLQKSVEERDANEENDGGPIMPKGAWNPPCAAFTPEGLKDGLQTYKPQKNN